MPVCANRVVSYGKQLEIAIKAARRAGDLLRKEFHRTGGPRGSGGHAEVDEKAEGIIFRILTETFSDYGYCGEELSESRPPKDPDGPLWLVDPNDGTSAFLKGFRGAAVSIALLRNGRPVLGVVYAYCAPDDNGDLFSWAEDAGPLTRNGSPCHREWPRSPSSVNTVLVSQHADKKPLQNARTVFPMRFRAIPSIAYRLALVAVDEGDVAVSLNGPVGWDYAAGHALLLGAAADLYDSKGNPIEYSQNQDGMSECGGRCFGGPPSLLREVVNRDWGAIFGGSARGREPYGLCWPVKGRAISDSRVLSRAQGCLLGQLAGDSLGSLVEFQSSSRIAEKYPDGVRLLEDGGTWSTIAGQPTDDSELALMLARSILKEGTYDQESTAQAYAYWYKSGPFDIGTTTTTALSAAAEALEAGGSAAKAAMKSADNKSQANGALMRVSPLGIIGAVTPREKLEAWARADALLTHPHPVCQEANVLFTAALSLAISTGKSPEEIYAATVESAEHMDADTKLLEALHAANDGPPGDFSTHQGWVLIAFQNAFHRLLHSKSLEAGVVNTVMCGGDTDTNAAIAGALLGATHGREAMPEQWLDRILTCRPLPGLKGVKRSRPPGFWPVDALWLAELLLTAGKGQES